MRGAAANIERPLNKVARFEDSSGVNRADHDIDGMLFEALEFAKVRNRNQPAVDEQSFETLSLGPARHLGMKTFARFNQGSEDGELTTTGRCFDLPDNRGE